MERGIPQGVRQSVQTCLLLHGVCVCVCFSSNNTEMTTAHLRLRARRLCWLLKGSVRASTRTRLRLQLLFQKTNLTEYNF